MSEFMVHRTGGMMTKTFNEAADYLKSRKDLTVLAQHEIGPQGGIFVIDTNDQVAGDLRRTLPGWTVSPNYTGYPS